jgi:hypothetical protein
VNSCDDVFGGRYGESSMLGWKTSSGSIAESSPPRDSIKSAKLLKFSDLSWFSLGFFFAADSA